MKILPPNRRGRLRLLALLGVLLGVGYFCNAQVLVYYLGYSPREGDIVFQSLPSGDLVKAIEGITHSPFSHCGVVLRENGHWVVMEAIGNVHATPLLFWMIRGRSAGIAAYRLDDRYAGLLPAFKQNLAKFSGLPYDYNYSMSDTEIYCSELPYKAFLQASGEEMGKLEKLGDLDWKPFEGFIRSVQGNLLPLDRLMITPCSLSHARQLHEVYRRGI